MMNDDVSTVPGVTRRVTRSQTRGRERAAVRETSVGEDVIFCKLIRDGALRHLNPWKLSDLQCVLEMRCFKGLLSDEDLKEVYFQRMWGFKGKWDFVLAGWQEMPVEDFFYGMSMRKGMKTEIRWALEDRHELIPGMKEHLMALGTKEEIMREYGMLAYVPRDIAKNAIWGAWALRRVREVGLENLGGLGFNERDDCLRHACRAGVDFSIIRSLYESLLVENRFAAGDGIVNAARGGHLDIVEALIGTLGVDVEAVDEWDSKTALMCAAENGHTATVNALAGTYNADVDAVDPRGRTALIYAAERGQTDTVNALAGTHSANVDAEDEENGKTALMCAAENGHTDTVHALAGTHNANVEAVDWNRSTALVWAAKNGHIDTVNALAGTHNANVDAVDPSGGTAFVIDQTALMRAAMNGHTDIVNALAGTHNANVDAVDRNGWTALMFAAQNGHTDTLNALAGTHNANLEAVDRWSRTALMLAATEGHTDIVNVLAGTYNANVDAVDQDGKTALMRAAEKGHTDTVKALRALGTSSEC
jgi:ankyrin repeat protein